MKYTLVLLILLISGFAFPQNNFKPFCDSLAADYLKNQPGVIVIGIYNNGNEKIFYYGETVKGNNKLPDSSSIFELGNLSETFTSMLLADCELKGIVNLDDDVNKYLPVTVPPQVYQPLVCKPFKSENDYRGYSDEDHLAVQFSPLICLPDSTYEPQPVLLCYLSTHTSGLPALPTGIKKNKPNPYAEFTTDDLYNFLRSYRIEKPIGFDYKHSETGMALLGAALSNKLKKSYEELLITNFFDTLKMTDTRITLNEEQEKRYLPGYDIKGKRISHWKYNALAPAGGLHSSISDMMKFLSKNITVQKNYFSNLLDYTHNPRLKIKTGKDEEMEIGLGWKISSLGSESGNVVWNSGQTGGFASYIGFVEPNHKGVVILSSISKDVSYLGPKLLLHMNKEITE